MDADLDLLLISVCCTADDLLPEPTRNARRRLSDAEIVTLCVAQVLMGVPSDRRFLRAARRQLGHLFPYLPSQDALHKRRARLAETIEWLVSVFAPRLFHGHPDANPAMIFAVLDRIQNLFLFSFQIFSKIKQKMFKTN